MGFKLNEPSPTSVMFRDTEIQIDMAFDNIIEVMEALNDVNESNALVKCFYCLSLLCIVDSDFLDSLEDRETLELFGLIRSELIETRLKDEEVISVDLRGQPLPKATTKTKGKGASYSLTQDASYIYSSFYQSYGIDLRQQIGKLHWHEFNTLLRDLSNETPFGRILEIRGTDLTKIKDKNERNRMKKLQEEFKLQ